LNTLDIMVPLHLPPPLLSVFPALAGCKGRSAAPRETRRFIHSAIQLRAVDLIPQILTQ
jgi:hypothetical protein